MYRVIELRKIQPGLKKSKNLIAFKLIASSVNLLRLLTLPPLRWCNVRLVPSLAKLTCKTVREHMRIHTRTGSIFAQCDFFRNGALIFDSRFKKR